MTLFRCDWGKCHGIGASWISLVGPKSNSKCPYKRHTGERYTEGTTMRRQRQRVGWSSHKSRKAWRHPEQEKKSKILPWSFWREHGSANTWISNSWPPEPGEDKFLRRTRKYSTHPSGLVFFTVERTDNMKSPLLKKFQVNSTVLLWDG